MFKLKGAVFTGTLAAESLRYPNTQLLSIPFGSESIHAEIVVEAVESGRSRAICSTQR
jgi:hypothetical protein